MTNSRSSSPDFTFSEDDTEPDDIEPDYNIPTSDHSTNDQPSLEMFAMAGFKRYSKAQSVLYTIIIGLSEL